MNCTEAREILQNMSERAVPAARQQVARQHLATCPDCQAALAQLEGEIHHWKHMCSAVQQMLPMYVEDELAAASARARYPRIWQHLRECPTCARTYTELRGLVQREREGKWVEPPFYPSITLPFLRPDEPVYHSRSWSVEPTRDAQGYLAAIITISRDYIKQILSPHTPAWARSARHVQAPAVRFPILDSLLEDRSWLIGVEVVREAGGADAPERWHIQISLVSQTPAGRFQIRVGVDDQERVAIVDDEGVAFFSDVPAAWLLQEEGQPSQLRIDLQQIEP